MKQWGDPDYGGYGVGWCNPAYYDQEPVPNEVYLETLRPDYESWYVVMKVAFGILDDEFPGWQVVQIKEKFGECRFYADPHYSDLAMPQDRRDRFQQILRVAEATCDAGVIG